MTNEATSPLKVNIMTPQQTVLTALFKNIQIGSTKSTPAAAGIAITSASAGNIASEVYNAAGTAANTGTSENSTWRTRAAVISSVSCLTSPGTTWGTTADQGIGKEIVMDTDAKKEELIGKFVNLTKVPLKSNITVTPSFARGTRGPDYYTVIIIAQSIKDIGGSITIKKKDSGGTVRSSTPAVEYGIFDYDSTNDVYFDEITATRKMIARIYRDPFTGKCKIINFSYLD